MNKKVLEKHTIGEIVYNFIVNILFWVIPLLSFGINFYLMRKIDINSDIIKDISNAFITVSGILPGLLLTFIATITELPEKNDLIKNIKKQGYFELLYKIIFLDIILWVLTLLASIIMIFLQEIIIIKIAISLFISSVLLFVYGFIKLGQIILLINR